MIGLSLLFPNFYDAFLPFENKYVLKCRLCDSSITLIFRSRNIAFLDSNYYHHVLIVKLID